MSKNKIYSISRLGFLTLMLLITFESSGAKLNSSFGRAEYFWALTHPLKISKAIEISKIVEVIVDSIERDSVFSGRSGGNLDAFKHCLWSAMMSNEIGEKSARKLCYAHERTNKRDFIKGKATSSYEHSLMDSLNNNIGLALPLSRKSLSQARMIEETVRLVKSGILYRLKSDGSDNYMDCNGNIITITDQWQRNICLIATGAD